MISGEKRFYLLASQVRLNFSSLELLVLRPMPQVVFLLFGIINSADIK